MCVYPRNSNLSICVSLWSTLNDFQPFTAQRPLHSAPASELPNVSRPEMENAIAPAGKAAGKTVCFDCSKREIFTPSSGLKVLRRRLQTTYKVTA